MPPFFVPMGRKLVQEGLAPAGDFEGGQVFLETEVEEAVLPGRVFSEDAGLAVQPGEHRETVGVLAHGRQPLLHEVEGFEPRQVVAAAPCVERPGEEPQHGEGRFNVQRRLASRLGLGPFGNSPAAEQDTQALVVERHALPGHLAAAQHDDAEEGEEQGRADQDLPGLCAVARPVERRGQPFSGPARLRLGEVGQGPRRLAEPEADQVAALLRVQGLDLQGEETVTDFDPPPVPREPAGDDRADLAVPTGKLPVESLADAGAQGLVRDLIQAVQQEEQAAMLPKELREAVRQGAAAHLRELAGEENREGAVASRSAGVIRRRRRKTGTVPAARPRDSGPWVRHW